MAPCRRNDAYTPLGGREKQNSGTAMSSNSETLQNPLKVSVELSSAPIEG